MKPSLFSCTLRPRSACVWSSQRSLTTAHRPRLQHLPRAAIASPFPRAQVQQAFRRTYADGLPSPPTKRRGRGFFRWSWRVTYITALGAVGYFSYAIYLLRTPDEQYNPDPSKKTLVVLGKSLSSRLGNKWHEVDQGQALAGAPFPF